MLRIIDAYRHLMYVLLRHAMLSVDYNKSEHSLRFWCSPGRRFIPILGTYFYLSFPEEKLYVAPDGMLKALLFEGNELEGKESSKRMDYVHSLLRTKKIFAGKRINRLVRNMRCAVTGSYGSHTFCIIIVLSERKIHTKVHIDGAIFKEDQPSILIYGPMQYLSVMSVLNKYILEMTTVIKKQIKSVDNLSKRSRLGFNKVEVIIKKSFWLYRN